MKPLRIRIIGGSLAGLFAGVLLQRDGHDVRIYERSTLGLSGRGAGLVAQREVFQILRLIGVERIAHIGVVAKERIILDRAGQVAQTVATPQTQISWDVLYDSVASRFMTDCYRLDRQAVQVVDGDAGAVIGFADGSTDQADLVIGADGIGSVVRRAVDPETSENSFAGYVAWRGLLPETELPEAASLLLDRFAFYLAPGGQALGYLVPGPGGEVSKGHRRYNWVWYRHVPADALAALFRTAPGAATPSRCRAGGFLRTGCRRCDAMRPKACRRNSRWPFPSRTRPPFKVSSTIRRGTWSGARSR